MTIWSLTEERVAILKTQVEAKRKEVSELEGMTPEKLWLRDLEEIRLSYP